jgi:hypothetical protein
MTKLDRLRWLLVNTEVEEDIPAIAELIRAEEVKEAKAFMESRNLTAATPTEPLRKPLVNADLTK